MSGQGGFKNLTEHPNQPVWSSPESADRPDARPRRPTRYLTAKRFKDAVVAHAPRTSKAPVANGGESDSSSTDGDDTGDDADSIVDEVASIDVSPTPANRIARGPAATPPPAHALSQTATLTSPPAGTATTASLSDPPTTTNSSSPWHDEYANQEAYYRDHPPSYSNSNA